MGILAYVYRWNGTNSAYNLISTNQVCVENVDGPFEPSEQYPAVRLVRGNLPGVAKIVPANDNGKWLMFGGAFVACSDSRFSRAVEKLTQCPFDGALPLHDRTE